MRLDKTRWFCPWNSDQNFTQNSSRGGGGEGLGGGKVEDPGEGGGLGFQGMVLSWGGGLGGGGVGV